MIDDSRPKISWTLVPPDLPPSCGAPSSDRKTAMHCELPHDHMVGTMSETPMKLFFHQGRNRVGAWRTWPMKA